MTTLFERRKKLGIIWLEVNTVCAWKKLWIIHFASTWSIGACIEVKGNFLIWPICQGCLPTRARLREINCPTECVVCTENYDDAKHILFYFPMVVNVWKTYNLWEVIEKERQQSYTVETILFVLMASYS